MARPKRRLVVVGRDLVVVATVAVILSSCQRPFFDEPGRVSLPPTPTSFSGDALRADPQPETVAPTPSAVFAPGSDVMIRSRAGAPTSLGALPTQGEVTLNFVDADLREVLRAVLGDTLGRNYIVDPNVQGTVTLRTSRPIPVSALLSTIEDILALNNAALVEAAGVYKVVPADQAMRAGSRPRVVRGGGGAAAGNSGLVVVPLRYASAGDMARVLEPLAQPNGSVTPDPERNVLLVGGTNTQVAAMLDLVDTFDVDSLSGKSFGLFPVETTRAETMVANLEEIFGSQENGPLYGVLRLVPIERLNAVLVISARAAYLERARDWIVRLDAGQEEIEQIFVYRAENSRAADLASVLSDVFPSQATTGRGTLAPGLSATQLRSGGTTPRRTTSAQPPRSSPNAINSLQPASLSMDADGADDGLRIGQVDTTPSTSGTTGRTQDGQTTQQRQRTQTTTQRTQRGLLGQAGAETLELGPYGEVRIVADEVKNAVVVYAKPRAYRLIEQALRKLDTVPLQVLIEATILEVTLNDRLQYGVEWFFHSGDVSVSSLGAGALRTIGGGDPSPLGGFTFLFKQNDIRVLVNALDAVTDVNVVSSPQLFVLDNQTGTINVGQQVPTVTQSSQSQQGADSPIVNSIQYVDTGVILTVTPRVNRGGLVSMDIVQTVSDAVPTKTSSLDTPTIRQRVIESSVAIQSGETVTLGGLIRDSRDNSSSGIPYLSRIPVIGWLFGTKSDNAERNELLVLITPRVVANQEEARRVTDELRQRVRRVINLEERIQ